MTSYTAQDLRWIVNKWTLCFAIPMKEILVKVKAVPFVAFFLGEQSVYAKHCLGASADAEF